MSKQTTSKVSAPKARMTRNAWVSVKLPIGVAVRLSDGWVDMPCAPMCAVTADPYLRHPPPDAFVQACRRAVVLPRECAVTVITRVAEPVE